MTNIFETINADQYTVADLDTFKKELVSYLKERRAEEKAEIKANSEAQKEELSIAGKAIVEVGKVVEFSYKDGTASGRVTKVSEKTFTVTLLDDEGEEVIGDNGKPTKIWRYFYMVSA